MDKQREKTSTIRCLECGKIFLGRKSQKFCCLECKNSYNNRRIARTRRFKSHVLGRITRNYDILEGLVNSRCTSLPLEELEVLGFDSKYITGYRRKERGSEYKCFDLRYQLSERKLYNLYRTEVPDEE